MPGHAAVCGLEEATWIFVPVSRDIEDFGIARVDYYVIDGLVEGAGLTAEAGGGLARRAETGNVQHYAFVYLLGAVAVAAYYLYLVLG